MIENLAWTEARWLIAFYHCVVAALVVSVLTAGGVAIVIQAIEFFDERRRNCRNGSTNS